MPLKLSAEEARIIGCLMEKSVVTPNQYPLTLNALTNACNQKSGRNPVMSLDKATVQRAVRLLDARHLIRIEENFKTGVEKYVQRFCNTRNSDLRLDPAQFAIICVLLLRGPRTPGEIKANSGRLHSFADNAAVVTALDTLIEWEGGPLIVKLPRAPGRRDPEYMHLFSDDFDVDKHLSEAQTKSAATGPERIKVSDLAQRVNSLEADVDELKEQLKALQSVTDSG